MCQALPSEIHAERLYLRRPEISDAPVIFQSYTQDIEVCRFMTWKPHDSEAATYDYIAMCMEMWEAGKSLPYVIAECRSNKAIGMLEARIQGKTIDIGYVLARSYWGHGLMPEAIRALASTSLANPHFFRIQATCDIENISSQRALEKSGFIREGHLERYTVHPNLSPEPRACFMYASCRK